MLGQGPRGLHLLFYKGLWSGLKAGTAGFLIISRRSFFESTCIAKGIEGMVGARAAWRDASDHHDSYILVLDQE